MSLLVLHDPNRAWLVLLVSIILVYRECAAPGRILPGVLGAVGIVVSLTALYQHPWNLFGVLMIGAGIGLILVQGFVRWFWIPGIIGSALLAFGVHRWTDPPIGVLTSLLVLPLSGTTMFLLRTAVLGRQNKVSLE